ncbi:MAG TPA: helix-turn-helix domain-containing protein [Gemmatimonadales bacterium]|nr:TetR/AcrR family transcriptional regulator [Gemmatimonadales bacterium]HPF62861.1 helix-turn-helix domain-containing protein [Gemmatimonadales bacterium]HRX17421.1 helix-turn-helix domain-containing protein [Gemmatimonadales bacterium]
MSTRDALLEVTARLFADHGWRGTTTRRIAEAAGVNEVTVFRTFGSKDALLMESIRVQSAAAMPDVLPAEPGDLRSELTAWGMAHHARLHERRSMIRTCLAEFEEHPELGPVACEGAEVTIADSIRYLGEARRRGLLGPEGSLEAATVMLMNAIFLDAITRDVVPGCAPVPAEDAVAGFVDLTLRALGAGVAA